MAQNSVSTGFSMYSPRRLERVAFGSFQGAGIDQFTDPTSQDPNKFLNLTNVMPAISGGFLRRWGLNQQGSALANTNQYARMFTYAAALDTTFSGSTDNRLLLATDNVNIDAIYADLGSVPNYNIPAFSGTGEVYGVGSRDWFYAMDGVGTPQKIDYSQRSSNTSSRMGIPTPGGQTINGITYFEITSINNGAEGVSGTGYVSPVVTVSGGGGTGATATAVLSGAGDGGIYEIIPTNAGSGYTTVPTVTITDSSGPGTGAMFTAVVGGDSTDSATYEKVIAYVMAGPMTFNSGRQYVVALQNSITGHTSDFIYSQYRFRYPLYGGTASYVYYEATYPGYNLNTGCTNIPLTLNIPAASVDSQVDTVVLMATSDGGDLEHLYEVATFPLSSFTLSGGVYSLFYSDTTPDTYNDQTSISYSGSLLLNANLWVDTDTSGNTIGIADNTPPLNTITKPILHKGRMFATDGRSLYFSKSIDEVTTSTGLITSKWEEAWPGTNVLDITYDDELINGLLSDGDVLYLGTSDNVYRLLGDNASNFSIPATIFRGVGLVSQDAWSVVYKDDVPAGYTWVTPDGKIMFSDFNNYHEIGKPIDPLLSGSPIDPSSPGVTITHIQSLSYGPYSFAVYSGYLNNSDIDNSVYWFIYDTEESGWYQWIRTASNNLYDYFPCYAFTNHQGIEILYTIIGNLNNNYLQYFDITNQFQDYSLGSTPAAPINWLVETSWLNLQDTASSVVLNELEVWSDDAYVQTSVYRALNSGDFGSPILVRTQSPVLSPFGSYKSYLAGAVSFGRYHKFQFFTDTASYADTTAVLRQFQVELFPHTRA